MRPPNVSGDERGGATACEWWSGVHCPHRGWNVVERRQASGTDVRHVCWQHLSVARMEGYRPVLPGLSRDEPGDAGLGR